jgi:CheY-like chemotaxis protein
MLGPFQSRWLTSRCSDWKEASRSLQRPATDGSARSKNRTVNPKRILIVEDNIDSARSLALLVHEIGHRAEYAINGYAALAAVRTFRPEIILLDLGLPGMSGFEFCSRIKADEQTKAIRILVLSAYADDDSRLRSKALGCELHLVKPVPTDVLEELLR